MKRNDDIGTDHQFWSGGGEMGKLIRAKNWSKTPLGSPESWPQCLRTMVSVMLNNPFGMYIAWGKEYTQIYNDGYRPILGSTKHPQALGNSTRKTFSEIWHIIESMFDGVMDGVPVGFPDFMLPLDRNGFVENCYFDFAYSPIKMENGEVGGVLVTVIETTNKKKAEDELKESKKELEFVIEAAQLGTFDFDPKTNRFSGNARLKQWFGLPPNEQIDLMDAINAIAENDKESVTNAIQQALQFSSGGIFDVEYSIINPDTKKETVVHAKGKAWFDEDKVAYRMNGTLEDVTVQTKARRETAQSEQNIRNMVLDAPVGICVIDAETMIAEIANEQFIEIARRPYNAIVGKHFWESFSHAKPYYEEALDDVVKTGNSFQINEVEFRPVRNGKEEKVYVTFVYAPVKNEAGRVIKVAVWVVDNTMQVVARQKIAESETNLKLMILQAPVAIAILKGMNYTIEIANKHALKIFGRTEAEILGKSAFTSMPELLTQGIKELLDEVRTSGNRFAIDELPIQFMRNGVMETSYVNFSYEPLFDEDGEINSIMAIGIDVTSQVTARQKVEQSEYSIRALVESAPFPIGVYVGKEMRITLANQSIMDVWGKGNDVVGKLYTNILPELENQQIFEQVNGVFSTGIPFHASNQKVDLLIDGKLRSYYFNYSFTPLFDASGNVYGVMNTAAEVTELHEAKQKVEESEKRFRDSVQQAPLGIAIFRGADYIAEMANENYLLLVDKKESEFVGRPLFTVLPEVKSLVEPLFRDVINSGNAFYSPELSATLKRYGKLEQAYFNLVYHPLKEEDGSITGIMVVATEVTETVRAKHLLEESEKHFRNMVLQSPIPMTILRGKDHIIESANRVMFEKVWHKKEAEVIGRSILDVFPELKEQKYPELLNEVFTSGKTHSEKESLALVKGDNGMNKFYLDFEYAALFEPDGNVSGIMITVNDVTDKVLARQKVENAEERLRLATEATEIATWELDLQTRHIIHSPRLAVIFGHDKSAVMTHLQMRSQIHPEDIHDIVEKAFDEAMISGIYKYEARVVRPDNTICWIRTQGKVFFDENNKPYKKLGTLRDITEEKQSQQALLEREQKFRLLADSMPQHIWTSDPKGNLNYCNQSLCDYTGMSAEKIYRDGWIDVVHPDDREENIRMWLEAINTGNDYLFEHRFKRNDGEYRWHLSRALPQKNDEGIIQMWVGSSTDIQSIKEQEQQKDYFISMASHELKTPLTSIKGYVQLLQTMHANDKDSFLLNALKTMDRQIIRLTKLISELLDISKIKSGGLDFNKENFEMTALIKEVVTEIKHINPQYEIPVVAQAKAQVFADRDRISQVLINLLTNAVKYSPQSKIIKVNCRVNGSWVNVSIQDFGIGINKNEQEKVFERFYRVEGKNEKTFPGFGIGLFISSEIIKKHNGKINLESEPGKGSIFSIDLPVI